MQSNSIVFGLLKALGLVSTRTSNIFFFFCFFLSSFSFSGQFFNSFFAFIRKKHFCGVVAEAFESKTNVLYVRFFSTQGGMSSDFSFLYTAFTKKKAVDGKNTTLACGQGEFDCDDDTCIDIDLVCDGQSNCKFKKDETNCKVCIRILN